MRNVLYQFPVRKTGKQKAAFRVALQSYAQRMGYSYREEKNNPFFEKIQTVSTLNNYHAGGSTASALNLSEDFNYLCSSNAGDNSASVYRIDQKTGLLTRLLCLPISGEYPNIAR